MTRKGKLAFIDQVTASRENALDVRIVPSKIVKECSSTYSMRNTTCASTSSYPLHLLHGRPHQDSASRDDDFSRPSCRLPLMTYSVPGNRDGPPLSGDVHLICLAGVRTRHGCPQGTALLQPCEVGPFLAHRASGAQ